MNLYSITLKTDAQIAGRITTHFSERQGYKIVWDVSNQTYWVLKDSAIIGIPAGNVVHKAPALEEMPAILALFRATTSVAMGESLSAPLPPVVRKLGWPKGKPRKPNHLKAIENADATPES